MWLRLLLSCSTTFSLPNRHVCMHVCTVYKSISISSQLTPRHSTPTAAAISHVSIGNGPSTFLLAHARYCHILFC
ncbi:hypothetical protein IWX49DRAFT_142564 [Phyllosticta citricarpa]